MNSLIYICERNMYEHTTTKRSINPDKEELLAWPLE